MIRRERNRRRLRHKRRWALYRHCRNCRSSGCPCWDRCNRNPHRPCRRNRNRCPHRSSRSNIGRGSGRFAGSECRRLADRDRCSYRDRAAGRRSNWTRNSCRIVRCHWGRRKCLDLRLCRSRRRGSNSVRRQMTGSGNSNPGIDCRSWFARRWSPAHEQRHSPWLARRLNRRVGDR